MMGRSKTERDAPVFFLFPSSITRLLFFNYCYFYWRECPAGASAEERVQERLTGTASETTPQAKPVIMRPAYSMA